MMDQRSFMRRGRSAQRYLKRLRLAALKDGKQELGAEVSLWEAFLGAYLDQEARKGPMAAEPGSRPPRGCSQI